MMSAHAPIIAGTASGDIGPGARLPAAEASAIVRG